MDARLIAWARGVKRRRPRAGGRASLPPLWFFTDETRLADPLPVIRRLPAGLCGVLFRHDSHPARERLAQAVARLCRTRRLPLIIAGDARLAAALGAGLHLRGGAAPAHRVAWRGPLSASAHDHGQLARARRAGVALVFISPVFPTASHPGAPSLGARGWRCLAARGGRIKPYALGGITGRRVSALGKACAGIGAIDAFL
ncbi:thiamine phosphate synthase [Acidocella sp.]|uniref:thiamine phosphate synthase n=1 Tax=Acidocella sp. TaxID=50710 RepID=UPI003D078467